METILNREIRALLVAVLVSIPLAASGSESNPAQDKGKRDEAKYQEKLKKEVRHQFLMLPWYSVFDDLKYEVQGDKVTLYGSATRPSLKSDAEAAVKSIEGVASVTNKIEVLPPSSMDDRLRRALYRAIYSESGLFRYSIQAIPSVHIIVRNGA
jgi:hyperosmotically inducible protein